MKLDEMIDGIEKAFHVSVCIHDVSGITNFNSMLMLDYSRKSHAYAYCTQVKALMSKATCMRQKQIVMRRLRINKGEPFFGTCYMGVSEYIHPIIRDGRLLCVLFVSGAPCELRVDALAKRERTLEDAPKDGPRPDYDRFCKEHQTSLPSMRFIAQLLEDKIRGSVAATAEVAAVKKNHDGGAWKAITPVPQIRTGWLISDFVPYIQENYRSRLTLRMLSDMFFINPEYLSRIFSKQMGQSITRYVNTQRMRQAAIELVRTDKQIADIAIGLGVEDVNYFYRLFKAEHGMTAKQYRQKYRNTPKNP